MITMIYGDDGDDGYDLPSLCLSVEFLFLL